MFQIQLTFSCLDDLTAIQTKTRYFFSYKEAELDRRMQRFLHLLSCQADKQPNQNVDELPECK